MRAMVPGVGRSVKWAPEGMLDSGGSCSRGPELGMKRIVEMGATRGFDEGGRGIGIGTVGIIRSELLVETYGSGTGVLESQGRFLRRASAPLGMS